MVLWVPATVRVSDHSMFGHCPCICSSNRPVCAIVGRIKLPDASFCFPFPLPGAHFSECASWVAFSPISSRFPSRHQRSSSLDHPMNLAERAFCWSNRSLIFSVCVYRIFFPALSLCEFCWVYLSIRDRLSRYSIVLLLSVCEKL